MATWAVLLAYVIRDYVWLDGTMELAFSRMVRAEEREAMSSEAVGRKPVYVLGLTTVRKVAELGSLQTEDVAFVAADDLIGKSVFTGRPAEELAVKVLEIAQLREDTDEGGIADMPDEQEWGEIVGIARKMVQP